MNPEDSYEGASKKLLWFIGIGAVLFLGIVITLLVFFLHKQQLQNATSNEKNPATLTVGQYPYIYPCSVATISNYENIFGLNDGGTIGYQYEASAYSGASGDLAQLAPELGPDTGYTSSCALRMPKTPTASSETAITVTLAQFGGTKGANDSLSRDQLAAANASSNPNAAPPTLPSYVTNSVVTVPTAPNNTLEASIARGNLYLTLDYDLQTGDTEAAIVSKFDAFAKTILANVDNKDLAARPDGLSGHATFLNTPFVDVCKDLDLAKLPSIFSGMQFRPDSVTNDSQYGAPGGSPDAGNGVVSSCGLTFSTAADRAGFRIFNASPQAQALQLSNLYPQSLRLSMNTYASPSDAKAAWTAKKIAQNPTALGPTLQAVSNLGDEAYTFHGENIYQKSAINQSAGTRQVSYKLIEDDYVILDGPHLITISFQQNSETDPYTTGPQPISANQIQGTFRLFQDIFDKPAHS